MMDRSENWCREIVVGAARYARTVSGWFTGVMGEADTLQVIENGGPITGVIGILLRSHPESIRVMRRHGVRFVNISNTDPLPENPSVFSDDAAIGHMGAEHLLAQGFRNLAFIGFSDHVASSQRMDGFCRTVRSAGHVPTSLVLARQAAAEPQIQALLRRLKLPAAIMTVNDALARLMADLCSQPPIMIPDQIALLGVDNDVTRCELTRCPFSSVVPNFPQIGYLAAEMLHALLRGRKPPQPHLLVPPLRVEVRRSTDVLAVDDPVVSRALTVIRDRACDPISVKEVLQHVPLSRRPLEIRFQRAMGRTLHAEIMRVRLERARQLLVDTTQPVARIAESTGFFNLSRFAAAFRKQFGATPSALRAQSHGIRRRPR